MRIFHIWYYDRTAIQVATHQVLRVLFIWVPNDSRGLASRYSLLYFFLGEPLIFLSDRMDKHHSLIGGLQIRQPIIILYEIGGDACIPVGNQIVPIITVVCDMVLKILEGRDTKDIINTTEIDPCFNNTIVPHPVGLGGPYIGVN